MIKCPTCKVAHEYRTDNAHRPFCSARCKAIDGSAWAQEHYRVSRALTQDDEEWINADITQQTAPERLS